MSAVQAFDELKASLESLKIVTEDISSKFKTTPGYSILLLPNDPAREKIGLDKRERSFELSSPMYVSRVVAAGENLKNIEITIVGPSGMARSVSGVAVGGNYVFYLNDFCTGFRIKSKTKIGRPSLSSIQIFGFDSISLLAAKKSIVEYFNERLRLADLLNKTSQSLAESEAKIASNQSDLDELVESVGSSKEELEVLAKDISDKTVERNSLLNSCVSLQERIKSLTAEELAKSNNCQRLVEEARGLNAEVAKTSQELSILVNDKSLISDEFRDYVKEGRGQSAIYLKLMVVPCFVIGVCAVILYNGSHDLLFGKYETRDDLIAALVLRVPFAGVIGAAIYYSWYIGEKFLGKIFSIQDERLTLAKLLVIAKDSVFSTAEQTGVSASEKFQLRTRLKIEMLKAHLAKNLGGEFKFPVSPDSPGQEQKLLSQSKRDDAEGSQGPECI